MELLKYKMALAYIAGIRSYSYAKRNFVSILTFLLCINFSAAQNILDNNLSGFEKNGSGWVADSSGFITITDSMAKQGLNSMRYWQNKVYSPKALVSIDTRHTITLVRTAKYGDFTNIIASTSEGGILAVSFSGQILWKNDLSGLMIHDMWCADINKDGKDEIFIANADGAAYSLSDEGKVLWKFQPNEVPMYSITVVHNGTTPYIVCGGFDLAIYYLNGGGRQVKKLHSSQYSVETVWGIDKSRYDHLHYANFLRPYMKPDGSEALLMHGNNNHMQTSGSLYFFEVLADSPYNIIDVKASGPIGDMSQCDLDNDGVNEVLLGTSAHFRSTQFVHINPENDSITEFNLSTEGFGYLITHTAPIIDAGEQKIFALHGSHLHLVPTGLSPGVEEYLKMKHAFFDMWQYNNKIILASAQSGGSCIHILDLNQSSWKEEITNLNPPGKIAIINYNSDMARTNIRNFVKPDYQREQVPIYLMTESTGSGYAKTVADDIRANYNSPVFLGGSWYGNVENWDRSAYAHTKYLNTRDARKNYVLTQQEALDMITPWYNGQPGIAFWGGHGNDPLYFQLGTHQQIMDYADGKKTVLIFPELEDHSDDFTHVMDHFFYPMAEYAKTRNTNIYVRSKHNFWTGNAYQNMWQGLMDGEYADVFVPSMEETTDKAMDISVPARMGIWASGAVNQWGSRSVPDNYSFDRSRQFGYQTIPNHFLRHTIYNLANGATYINNFGWNPDYMSLVWELLARGALFVPRREEIVSFSPVHISIHNPDEHFMDEGSSMKFSVFYNEEFENNNPFVISRQNATWPGAQLTHWDYSRYASGVKDRRLNYLPPNPNGMVLFTPPQNGIFASTTAVRDSLKSYLNPIYHNILTEYHTDCRYYYSEDGLQQMEANEYYKTIENDIKDKASLLPVTVEGTVAWVVAQLDDTHLRLTLIDGGYVNPDLRNARVCFNTVTPVAMFDILDGKSFDISDKSNVEVDVPLGLFRFIDIELDSPLY